MKLRKFFVRLRRKEWIHPQSLLVIFVFIFMLGVILFSGNTPEVTGVAAQAEMSTGAGSALLLNQSAEKSTRLLVTATPPPDLNIENEQQTDGVILAAVLVILVIVGGTLFSISRRR